ncbi:MAG: FKBP-type peptidyl-prolyl cis-trans isomerase [Arcticibacterium sp.]|jgi:FKBP-type peptidyl-prolyl cis-trans isomerase
MNRTLIILILSIVGFSCNGDGFSGPEDSQIDQYVEANNLTVTEKTASGLVYILTSENLSGAALIAGQTVNVNYSGNLLSGKKFDSGNFSFALLTGRVVRGFDEGIAKMRVGEKATIIFPSTLGYGSQGSGSIPKNSPLVFDIEVLTAR